tara:strand:- start:54 stop:440 length:387 start_codon:yes stop_codon:yes gene_type:complete
MTAWELATVLVAIAALVVVAVLVNLVIQLRQVIKNFDEIAREIQSTVEQNSERMDRQANEIKNEYQRVDGLIDTAEKITSRANFVSELSYSIIAKPIMRLSSLLKGTFRVAKMLSRKITAESTKIIKK